MACRQIGRFTFSKPAVDGKMKEVMLLRVTANSAGDKALRKRFGLFGPPGLSRRRNMADDAALIRPTDFDGCSLYTSGSAVVSLMRCRAKLDFTSSTAGWRSKVAIMKREKWSMSSTCTRSR